MTNELFKHELKFDKTYSYFIKKLNLGNTLSFKAAQYIDLSNGRFYTLIPDFGNKDHLYYFEFGGLMPQGAPTTVKIDGKEYRGFKVINTDYELYELLMKKLQDDQSISIIFEDVENNAIQENLSTPETSFGKELYFIVDNSNYLNNKYIDNTSINFLEFSFKTASNLWREVIFLSRYRIHPSSIISEDDLNKLATNIYMIITSAYDGEGYVFWERSI